MTEQLIRDRVELEKRRDKIAEINRVAAIESAVAVLRTILDAHLKDYGDNAIAEEDLKALHRELEAEMSKQITHICDHFDSKTAAQSKDLLNEVRGMFKDQQALFANEQIAQQAAQLKAIESTRKEILRYGIGFALTVLSALVIFWLTTRGH